MLLADWLDRIESLHPKSWDLGLERVGEVADRLDLRRPGRNIFLVAGTNGKGSVCAFLDSLCRSLGLATGVTTSPHLLRFNERIVVNGVPATDDEICGAFAIIDEARKDISLTYFEFAALAAFLIFKQHRVDVAVLEVGLGGRLDAMNLVEPDISVITRIALDHQGWLGETRDEIAIEKAGIMRAARPCILGDTDMPAGLFNEAERLGCPLHRLGKDFDLEESGSFWRRMKPAISFADLPAPILPRANAAAAIEAVYTAGLHPDRDRIAEALSRTALPGRFQWLREPARTLLDVAHNPDAAALLSTRLREVQYSRCHAVMGMYADKDIRGVIATISPQVDCWYFADLDEPRGARAVDLADCVPPERGCEIRTYDKVCAAYDDAVQRSTGDDLILVFGSFPAVADVLGFLQLAV